MKIKPIYMQVYCDSESVSNASSLHQELMCGSVAAAIKMKVKQLQISQF